MSSQYAQNIMITQNSPSTYQIETQETQNASDSVYKGGQQNG